MLTSCISVSEGPLAARQLVRELSEADRAQVISLLSEDPMHSVLLYSFIEDNGFNHPSNRGRFYGYFANDHLLGVALLGHATLFYARPEVEQEAIACFAGKLVEAQISAHLIFGPQAQVEEFWRQLEARGLETTQVREMNWYVCQKPAQPIDRLQLRRANHEELDAVIEAHAEMFREATGSDPRDADAAGFARRMAERIERRRTWVSLSEGRVIFKAELQSLSPEIAYLEGVWVDQQHRGQKVARSCLTELVHRLLKQQVMVCLAVEADDAAATALYEQVGFVQTAKYQVRYLKPLR